MKRTCLDRDAHARLTSLGLVMATLLLGGCTIREPEYHPERVEHPTTVFLQIVMPSSPGFNVELFDPPVINILHMKDLREVAYVKQSVTHEPRVHSLELAPGRYAIGEIFEEDDVGWAVMGEDDMVFRRIFAEFEVPRETPALYIGALTIDASDGFELDVTNRYGDLVAWMERWNDPALDQTIETRLMSLEQRP